MQQVPGHPESAADHAQRLPVRPGVEVAPDVGRQHREQAVQVTAGAGGDKLLGDLPVLGGADVDGGA